ncbi:MAG: hypothetical protein BWX48_03172 [Verrucomicrobia bacterium ADurb.Bin006]|nr:MAG: hypothetical protein BWX48_03172 [Verrucomicrobia bacterium ADurb.Bin006]
MYTHFFHTFRKLGEDQGANSPIDKFFGQSQFTDPTIARDNQPPATVAHLTVRRPPLTLITDGFLR